MGSSDDIGGTGRARRRRAPWILLVLLVVAGGIVAAPWALRRVGHWLVVADGLSPVDAIYIHSGSVPFRAMAAGEVALAYTAPEVWLTPVLPSAGSEALAAIGIERRPAWDVNREVLTRLGVEAARIRVLDAQVVDTRDEVQAVLAEMEKRDLQRVILVTSPYHARRVRAIWRHYSRDDRVALVHPARNDPFDPDDWWRDMDAARAVLSEFVALADLWLGAPLSGAE